MNLSTYQAAVFQSRANRAIKSHIEQLLREYNLTMMQWSILGFVYEAGENGVRTSDLAKKINTSLAFITNSINTLEAKGMVYRIGHETDNRAKLIYVNAGYRKKVAAIEKELHDKLRNWVYKAITPDDMSIYVKVLQQLANEDQPVSKTL